MDWVRRKICVCITLMSGLFLLGCGGEGGGPELTVEQAWVRPIRVEMGEDGTPNRANSAAYLLIQNRGTHPDRLLVSETSVAGSVELHESFLEGDVMRMREVGPLEVPGNGKIELRPGGLHLMLLDLRQSLMPGDTITLTLQFQNTGAVEVRAPVRSTGRM